MVEVDLLKPVRALAEVYKAMICYKNWNDFD